MGLSKIFVNNNTQIVGVDDEPTAGSDNLVKSGGVYNANNLFTHPMANKVIKELYIPGVDYTSIYKLQLSIAAFRYENYVNRIALYYTLNEISKKFPFTRRVLLRKAKL